jgi:hypothetical protein
MKETAVNETGLTVIEDVPSEVATADLLGSSPRERIAQASAVAEILAPVIREQRLYAMIGRKEYVTFEGWTLLGSLLGVFPVTESVAEIERDGVLVGFTARVVAKTLGGQVVGAAVGRCMRSEERWANAEEHALASMAATRAGSKALRMPLGFVMKIAGYQATPSEEAELIPATTGDAPTPAHPVAGAPSSPPPSPAPPSRSGGGQTPALKRPGTINMKQAGLLLATAREAGDPHGVHGFEVMSSVLKAGKLAQLPDRANGEEAKAHLVSLIAFDRMDAMLEFIKRWQPRQPALALAEPMPEPPMPEPPMPEPPMPEPQFTTAMPPYPHDEVPF